MKKFLKIIVILFLLWLSYMMIYSYINNDKTDINQFATVEGKKEFFKGEFNPEIIDNLNGDKYENLMYDILLKIVSYKRINKYEKKEQNYFELSNYIQSHIDEFLSMYLEKKKILDQNFPFGVRTMFFLTDLDKVKYVEKKIPKQRKKLLYFNYFNNKLIFSDKQDIVDTINDVKITKIDKDGKIILNYLGISEKGKDFLDDYKLYKKQKNLYISRGKIFYPILESFEKERLLDIYMDDNYNEFLNLYSSGKIF